jgi:hypothetical protein
MTRVECVVLVLLTSVAALPWAPAAAMAQDMRAACNRTREQVRTRQVSCDQIRAQRGNAQRALGESGRREQQTAPAQSFQRLHRARSTGLTAGIACYDAILASQCGGGPAGAGVAADRAAERAAVQQLEQQQRQLEQQVAAIDAEVQRQLEVSRALLEYVEQHMPWVLSDEERERLERARAGIQDVGATFDARSQASDREVEALQRRFGVQLPPGLRFDQVGSEYVVRDAQGRVRYRLERDADGNPQLVPSFGTLSDQELLVLAQLARQDPSGALRRQLDRELRARTVDGLRRRTRRRIGNDPIDGSHLEPVIDFPAPGAPLPDAGAPPASPASPPAPPPPAPPPPLPADDVDGDDPTTLGDPLADDEPLDPTEARDPTGPTDSPDRYADQVDFDQPATHDGTVPREPGAPHSDPDAHASIVEFNPPGAPPAPEAAAEAPPFDHDAAVRSGTQPPSREVPATSPGPSAEVDRLIREIQASDDAGSPGLAGRVGDSLDWPSSVDDATDELIRIVTPQLRGVSQAIEVGVDAVRILLPGGQHEWLADTVMWRFGEVVGLEPNPERPVNRVIRRSLGGSP